MMSDFIYALHACVIASERDAANQISVEVAGACGIQNTEAQRNTYSIELSDNELGEVSHYGTLCPLTQEMVDYLQTQLHRIPSVRFYLVDAKSGVLVSANSPTSPGLAQGGSPQVWSWAQSLADAGLQPVSQGITI